MPRALRSVYDFPAHPQPAPFLAPLPTGSAARAPPRGRSREALRGTHLRHPGAGRLLKPLVR